MAPSSILPPIQMDNLRIVGDLDVFNPTTLPRSDKLGGQTSLLFPGNHRLRSLDGKDDSVSDMHLGREIIILR